MTEKKNQIEHKGNMAVDVVNDFPSIMKMADVLLKSGFLPTAIKTPAQAAAVIIKGQEMDIPPMMALEHIHIVNGKPGMSAELMRTLILQRIPGAKITIKEMTDKKNVIVASRPGQDPVEFSFTIEEANKITRNGKSLTAGDGWRNYPKAMLLARNTSQMKRAYFPDVNILSYTPDEVAFDVTGGVDQQAEMEKYSKEIPTVEAVEETPVANDAEEQIEEVETEDVDKPKLAERLELLFDSKEERRKFVESVTGKTDWRTLTTVDIITVWTKLDEFENGGE